MSTELKKASVGLTFIGGILVFLIFGFSILVWSHFFSTKVVSLDEQRATARSVKRELLDKDNHAKLSGYAWVNKDKGVVQLPIERAMDLVSTDLAAKPVKASAVKVEDPYPYGLQGAPAAPAASGTAAPAPAATGTAAPPAASGTAAPQPATTPAPAK